MILYTKNIKTSNKCNKFKTSALTWNEWETIFCIIHSSLFRVHQKSEAVANNPPIRNYLSKIEKIITFKIKTRYYLECLMPETAKSPWGTKKSNWG